MIYIITTFKKVSIDEFGWPDYGTLSTVAYYTNYHVARNAIINNNCDMWETIYDYVVLETMPEGMYPTICLGYQCEYFKFNRNTECYEPIEKSEVEFDYIKQCWSIG